jgi:tetratricopeptide (TPR) repeat protein
LPTRSENGTVGDLVGQAHTHLNYAQLFDEPGQAQEALAHDLRALELYQAAGHRSGQAKAFNAVGWDHALLGDYVQALRCCEQAVAPMRETNDLAGLAAVGGSRAD